MGRVSASMEKKSFSKQKKGCSIEKESTSSGKFYTYILECQNGSLYSGYTTDIVRRLREHREGINSKYVRAFGFKAMRICFVVSSKSDAMSLESRLKRISRAQKLKLIESFELINTVSNINILEAITDFNFIE